MKSSVVVTVAFLIACAWANPFSKYFPRMKLFGTRNVEFTPAHLPCSVAIHADNEYRVVASGQVATDNMWYDLLLDNDVMRYTSFSYNEDSTLHREKAIRADQSFKRDGETYYPTYRASSKDDSCTSQDLLKADAKREIADQLETFTSTYEFINVTDTDYNGFACKKYFTFEERDGSVTTFTLYANAERYVIGLIRETTSEDQTLVSTSTLNVTYTFDVSLAAFSMNRTAFPNCADDAYATAAEQCGLYSSGASSESESSQKSESSFDFSSSSSSTKRKSNVDSSADPASKIQATISVVLAALAIAIAALL